jgi:hypothetical protein
MTENQTCPVRLDYPDEQPVSLDVTAIRTAGTRVRRRRRLAATATAGILTLAVAAGATILRPSSDATDPAAGKGPYPQLAGFLATNPPLQDPVVVDTWPAHWTTVAWATADGQFCYAAFRSPKAGTFPMSGCQGIDGDLEADFKVNATVGMPLPAMEPMESGRTFGRPGGAPTLHPFVGVVRGQVAQVVVTVHDQKFTAAVTPLTTLRGTAIGIFQVWIATGNGWNSTDIQNVVAYDKHGAVVAWQGQWIPPAKPTS